MALQQEATFPKEAAHMLMVSRTLLVTPVKLDMTDSGEYRVTFSPWYSLLCHIGIIALGAYRCLRLYFDIHNGILHTTSARLVRVGEFVMMWSIVYGTACLSKTWTEAIRNFQQHLNAVESSGVTFPPKLMKKSFRKMMVIALFSFVLLSWDLFKQSVMVKAEMLAAPTRLYLVGIFIFYIIYIMHVMIILTFVFFVKYLQIAIDAVVRALRKELNNQTSTASTLACLHLATDRQQLLRNAQYHICQASGLPIAFTVILIFVSTITSLYFFVTDIYAFSFGTLSLNLIWPMYHYGMLYLIIAPCHAFKEQDAILYDIVSESLINVKIYSHSERECDDVALMWDILYVLRSTPVEFILYEIIELKMDLFLTLSNTVGTYLVILVHFNENYKKNI